MSDIMWFTKQSDEMDETVLLPFRVDYETYTMVEQIKSMSQLYPGAKWLVEFKLIDHKKHIIIPYKNSAPIAGFRSHKTKKDALDYIKHNSGSFVKLLKDYPEIFV